jgi:hypothetical protein
VAAKRSASARTALTAASRTCSLPGLPSDHFAHPSLYSLLRHIELNDHGNAVVLRFGPEARDLPQTILDMTMALHRKTECSLEILVN